jgi:hypothetical protein
MGLNPGITDEDLVVCWTRCLLLSHFAMREAIPRQLNCAAILPLPRSIDVWLLEMSVV